jgi:FAD/FMN-containing dehydrogenase
VASGAALPSPDPSTLPAQAWRQLSRAMIGPLLRPGYEHFETLQRPATNRYPASHPQAIARCATPDDVAHAINFARRYGLETAVRGGGHSFADHSSTTGLLIETGLMDTVAVDGDLATIGAGAQLAEIYRTLPAGCGPTVGIAGLALGGGLGVLGRTYGLTCDRLTAAQIVLAHGAVITCDDTSDPDLYWALRGAGAGNFGVVTALSFRTVAEPQAVAFHLTWPDNDALATLIAWMEWAPKAPDAMAGSLVVRASADSSAPPQAHLIGAFLSDEPAAADALMHFERLAGAAVRNRKLSGAPISDVKAQLAEFGAEIGAGSATAVDHSASEFHREPLRAPSIVALRQALTNDRMPGQARELAFTPMGGAYNRVPADATAFVHRGDKFLLEYTATSDPTQPTATRRAAYQWLSHVRELLDGHGTGRAYQNFPDPKLADPLRAYYGQNLPRLRDVKRHLHWPALSVAYRPHRLVDQARSCPGRDLRLKWAIRRPSRQVRDIRGLIDLGLVLDALLDQFVQQERRHALRTYSDASGVLTRRHSAPIAAGARVKWG